MTDELSKQVEAWLANRGPMTMEPGRIYTIEASTGPSPTETLIRALQSSRLEMMEALRQASMELEEAANIIGGSRCGLPAAANLFARAANKALLAASPPDTKGTE